MTTAKTFAEQQLGDYQLIEYQGLSLLGERFIAEHRYLKKRQLLTLLPREISSQSDFIERFEAQLSSLARLEHPYLLAISGASEADGNYFLLTDLPKGMKILELVEQPSELVLQIAGQLAELLDYLHAARPSCFCGIFPENIYFDGTTICVADVGLSLLISETALSTDLCKKIFNQVLQARQDEGSSPSLLHYSAFLPPEGFVGPASDQYLFGVLLYFLLTGQYPIGLFELPTKAPWNELFTYCLQRDPQKRPLKLSSLLALQQNLAKPLLRPQQLFRPQYDPDPAASLHVDPVVATYSPKKEEKSGVVPLLTEMVVIPSGTYFRGSNQGGRDEMPRHKVTLSSFALDIYPVTNEQFVRFLEVMDGEKDAQNSDMIRLRDSRIRRVAGKLLVESGYLKHPAVGVTWYGALAYAAWIGKRLPTEAEWEIAASTGVEEGQYPTGVAIERSQANFFSSDTTSVMSYPPTGLGLYDMAGNVYEWCADWYSYNYYETSFQEPDNPKGPLQGVYRVLRGGCWKSLKEDMRFAHRHRNNPGSMNGTYGFRCAADVQSG